MSFVYMYLNISIYFLFHIHLFTNCPCILGTGSAGNRERHGEDFTCFPSCLSESPRDFVMP